MTGNITVEHLGVRYDTSYGQIVALDDVNIRIEPGDTVGIVGESGSGKTTLAAAISGGLSRKAAVSGAIQCALGSVLELNRAELRDYRRETIGYIGQDPHSALDPTMRVGRQLRYATGSASNKGLSEDDYKSHFGRVGLPDPVRVAALYPHQLSGGMAQRVVVALALARKPQVIVADEPTASLDSTLRTQILDLITELASASAATLLMISHDLSAIRRYCRLTAVMYGGRIVELAPTALIFERPKHPYSAALLSAAPGREAAAQRLPGIPGTQHVRRSGAASCVFAERCQFSIDRCRVEVPERRQVADHVVECHRASELTLAGTTNA